MSEASVRENLLRVRSEIADAARASGRKNEDIKLIAVSKTKPLSLIREAFEAGQKYFGENYVQEAVDKIEELPKAEWHLIGPLQTNKVKQIAGKVRMIHTLDREKLANEIEKAAAGLGIVQDVLIQVQIGGEVTKSGISILEAPKLIEQTLKLSHLRLRGLMSLPPLLENESDSRANFALLRECHIRWRKQLVPADSAGFFDTLSMGTSGDFRWAILEGATLVRVGSMIFGERETH